MDSERRVLTGSGSVYRRSKYGLGLLSGLLVIGSSAAQGLRASDFNCSSACEKRVDSILRQMDVGEKIDFLGGVDGFYIRAVPRLHLPALRMSDGPFGVRGREPSAIYAAGIALAASWDVRLAERVGAAIGEDARARGVHFMLAPGVNIYRSPLNGRNFEFFGEDPFLAGQIAVGYVRGMQGQGVSAVLKHFVVSSSEFDRHHADDVIDERALREIYLRPFESAVREANPGAVMDAYGVTNGVRMTENATLNSAVLKREWGFQGFIMSDWRATYDGTAAANGGLDLEMPSGSFMNRSTLLPALQKNQISMRTIDDKVRRILRVAVRFGWLDRSARDVSIPLYDQASNEVALESARESIVLLKNERAILPLNQDTVKSILIVGPNAYPAVPVGGGSAALKPFAATSDLEGLSNSLGTKAKVYYSRGLPTLSDLANATSFAVDEGGKVSGLRVETYSNEQLSGPPGETHIDQHVNYDGALPEDVVNVDFARALAPQPLGTRWTGYYTPKENAAYEIVVQGGGFESKYRLYIDGRLVIDCWRGVKAVLSMSKLSLTASPHKIVLESFRPVPFGGLRLRFAIAREGSLVDPEAEALAKKVDVVVVAVGFNREIERETGDRTFGLPFGQDELIQRMADKNPKTIVVLQSGGSVDMSAWLQRVPALIESWYPGQAGGQALAEVLVGETNPSGHLPITFERKLEDNPAIGSDGAAPETNRIIYKEGIFVGYRGFEQNGITPSFPFGFGLAYTTFSYRDLQVRPLQGHAGSDYEVSFSVTNTGQRAGAEVAQVYVAEPHARLPRPPKELKGFDRVELRPGESKQITVHLDERAFSYFDPAVNKWTADPGDFVILVGGSSGQIELKRLLTLPASRTSVSAR